MLAAKGVSGGRWSVGSVRFLRDVTASVLAAGIAAVSFSHLAHEPAPPAAQPHGSKSLDRLSWEMEEIPTRITRSYDSIAMFSLPRVEPVAWSEAPVRLAEKSDLPVRTAQADRPEREPRRAAILPPSKPPVVMLPVATQAPIVLAAASTPPEEHGLKVLGWQVPGTDLLPSIMPKGRAALREVVALGDSVVGAGKAVAETVGLR